jgi:hypothetical protein
MTVSTLADNAGQVIVGKVAAVRSYWTGDPRRIESEVTFDGVEYLKGRLANSSDHFTLIVPGGQIDRQRMAVCCAPDLRVGEKWMLFLLPSYHNFPVVGISQGAYLIKPDADGVERVLSRSHDRESTVTGIGEDGFVQFAAGPATDGGVELVEADNMELVTPQQREAAAISYGDFVKQLTPILAASRDHKLTAAAGRPDIVKYSAVPLRPSRLQKQRQADKNSTADSKQLRGQGEARPGASAPAPGSKSKEVTP